MIQVAEALRLVLERVEALPPATIDVEQADGYVIAEDIRSDIDSPPHDKSLVDGYAVRRADVGEQPAELIVVEEITAGRVPTRAIHAGEATRIMTGAPIPDGADAVVMVERTETFGADPQRVRVTSGRLPESGHILPRAASMRTGEIVIRRGATIRPVEIGLLSEVGRVNVPAHARPTVAVVATGDELVDPGEPLSPGAIRNSNGPMLAGLAEHAGGSVSQTAVARDQHQDLLAKIQEGLASDILLLSGGVSAGVLDLVPAVLEECGVQQVFHKVRLKPGKPLWFGVSENGRRKTVVFGLPGNPVSALVCFRLFVDPAIRKLRGFSDAAHTNSYRALLQSAHQHRGDRPTYHPAFCEQAADREQRTVAILPWRGSADLRALANANCLVHLPAGERDYAAGESVELIDL